MPTITVTPPTSNNAQEEFNGLKEGDMVCAMK